MATNDAQLLAIVCILATVGNRWRQMRCRLPVVVRLPFPLATLDGFSMSFGIVDGAFVVPARDRMIEPWKDSAFAVAVREMELQERGDVPGVLFQAELIGPGIRGNRYGIDGLQFFVFDAIRGGQFVSFAELETLCPVVT